MINIPFGMLKRTRPSQRWSRKGLTAFAKLAEPDASIPSFHRSREELALGHKKRRNVNQPLVVLVSRDFALEREKATEIHSVLSNKKEYSNTLI